MAKKTSSRKAGTASRKPAAKDQPPKTAKAETATTAKPKAKAKRAKEKPQVEKGPGVVASIVEFVQQASARKPISKELILERLTERFPDREPDKMRATINTQVPNRLRKDKGIDVQKNDKGYYVK